jgi:hypothetical protein
MMSGTGLGSIMGRPATINAKDFLLNKRQYMTLMQDQPGVFRKMVGGMLKGFGITDPGMGALAISRMTGIEPDEAMVMMKTIGMEAAPGFQRQQGMMEWRQAQRTARVAAGTGEFLNGLKRSYRGFTEGLSDNQVSDLSKLNILNRPGQLEKLGTYTIPTGPLLTSEAKSWINAKLTSNDRRAMSIYSDKSNIKIGLDLMNKGIDIEDRMVGGSWSANIFNSIASRVGTRYNKAYSAAGLNTMESAAQLRNMESINLKAMEALGVGKNYSPDVWYKKYEGIRSDDYWASRANVNLTKPLSNLSTPEKENLYAIYYARSSYLNKMGGIASALSIDKAGGKSKWDLAYKMGQMMYNPDDLSRYYATHSDRFQPQLNAYNNIENIDQVQKIAKDSKLLNMQLKNGKIYFAGSDAAKKNIVQMKKEQAWWMGEMSKEYQYSSEMEGVSIDPQTGEIKGSPKLKNLAWAGRALRGEQPKIN